MVFGRLTRRGWAWVLGLCAGGGWLTAQPVTLIATNEVWRYFKGRQEASDPVEAWRQADFDDAAWETGPATFYYGEDFAGTLLDDMRRNYTTLFLRKRFTVASPADVAELELHVVSDDGFLAWINGAPVAALRGPAGAPRFDSVAGGGASEPVRFADYPIGEPLKVLRPGENLLAIQAFNRALTSSDLVLDASLTAVLRPSGPPTVGEVQPAPGALTELTQVTVRFSEPVRGVNAADLRLNDMPATSVSGEGDTYTFGFAQPPFGTVVVAWDPAPGIHDLGSPAAFFDPLGPGSRWTYELYDDSAPAVIRLNPPAGRPVRSLTQVEVWFDRVVAGVDAADLLIDGEPSPAVAGAGAGPYVFAVPARAPGEVRFAWAADHGIRDTAPTPVSFPGGGWSVVLDPDLTLPDVVITEFMAQNSAGLRDRDGDREDWIELHNRSDTPADLTGWSLSDDPDAPGKWVFPALAIPPGGYAVVFASGKDRRNAADRLGLHTNFKLGAAGEYLGLFTPESPRRAVTEFAPAFPEQRNDHSYGVDAEGNWVYFAGGTPGRANGSSSITGRVEPVHISLQRGYYTRPITVTLYCPTPGATIRYTLDGSEPTGSNGQDYTGPITLYRTTPLRVAAFQEGLLPTKVVTRTYLMNLPTTWRYLPALSLVTDPANLFGATGIMETNPRNTTKRGIAWERPVSVELIRPEDNGGFHEDAGIRVQGGNYIRARYDYRGGSPPANKYSFRLYFRGDYGAGRLEYPLIEDIPIESFDTVVLRAGMNDPTNPFIRDEFTRRLFAATGQVTPRGTFVHLFLNGLYKGYYNPTERVDVDFLQSWHGGSKDYDLIAQFGEVRSGDAVSWNSLRAFIRTANLLLPVNWEELESRFDLVNFADYLIIQTYADTGDWPHNNWRAARERAPGAKWRFYMWDSEWAFGRNTGVSHNTFTDNLGANNGRNSEIGEMFQRLQQFPEWRLLFADRVHKHLFNDGVLTQGRLLAIYRPLRDAVSRTIRNFNNTIETSWIPRRMRYYTNHLKGMQLWASDNAPVFNQHGGSVPEGFALTMTAPEGTVYYTTDGADPRVRFSNAVSPSATRFQPGRPLVLDRPITIKARTLANGEWSALTEATFQVARFGSPLRISEIMYHPPGGREFEFLEILNTGPVEVDLAGVSLRGVDYRFPVNTRLAGNGRLVLASDTAPAAFAARYPAVAVAGWFGGSLANGGERVALVDAEGHTLTSVTYDDATGWPAAADGTGASLEVVDPLSDPDDPANWQASALSGGTPGLPNSAPSPRTVRINEVMADNAGAWPVDGAFPDWVELHNPGPAPVDLTGWRFTDGGRGDDFVFPATSLPAGGYLLLYCAPVPVPEPLDAWRYTGFGLDRDGETLALFDAAGRRVDAVTFGAQVTDFSSGRLPGEAGWHLLEPTPEGANEPATLAEPTALAINEYLPDSPPGADDWVELYNADPAHPAALQGLWFRVNDALARIDGAVFVPPAGFVVLRADEQPGPNHLDLRLPADGAGLELLTPLGGRLDRLVYSRSVEGVSMGRLPDGADRVTSFAGSVSPGAPNYVVEWDGPVLNEVLARSKTPLPDGPDPAVDWIEIRNPRPGPFDLSGFSLSVGRPEPGEWVFPVGTKIAGNGYLLLLADGGQPPSNVAGATLNIGRSLAAVGDAVHLFDPAGQVVDSVEFGFQLRDRSIGREGASWLLLATPTPGAPNAARAVTAAYTSLRINEWSANGPGDDWIEVFNPADGPVELSRLALTDDLTLAGQSRYVIPPLSYVGAGDRVLWIADGRPDRGGDHLPFSLDALGESLRLYTPTGTAIDQQAFDVQAPGASEGRFPDGATNLTVFTATRSPNLPNHLPHPAVVINEVLTHTDPPLEEAVEVRNLGGAPIDLGGWWLSDSLRELRKYRIPDGTTIPAGGYRVFFEGDFSAPGRADTPFHLPADFPGRVVLSEPAGEDGLSGYRAVAEFGPARNGVSWGRVETSAGVDFAPLAARSFGVDSPLTVAQFRQSRGAANAPARVGPVAISEIMYHPVTGVDRTEEASLEYVELLNLSDQPVPLFNFLGGRTNHWRLTGAVEFEFGETTLAPGGRLLVTPEFPDAAAYQRMLATYGLGPDAALQMVGPFRGRLDNAGERLRLLEPAEPVVLPDGATETPLLLVDQVDYSPRPPWPGAADGGGFSLQRRNEAGYGNEALNWAAGAPTPLGPPDADAGDQDGDGLPDAWEWAHGLDLWSAEGDQGADGDPDGDGLTNWQEFQDGTDPREMTIRFSRIWITGRQVHLAFAAAAGHRYRVEYRDALDQGEWTLLTNISTQSQSGEVSFWTLMPEASPTRYYRLVGF